MNNLNLQCHIKNKIEWGWGNNKIEWITGKILKVDMKNKTEFTRGTEWSVGQKMEGIKRGGMSVEFVYFM